MYNNDELKKKEALLLKAFTDPSFDQDLKKARLSIEELLNSFVSYLKTILSPEQKIYENIESRPKSLDSFREKLYRKDYIKTWIITDNLASNQRVIATQLPDLLGFRINCFFWQDEKVIYDALEEYYKQGKMEGITLDFSENKKQANGHIIYKVTGVYQDSFCFEIQIKAIMHNIWGEVEHKTIYKNRSYEPDLSSKIAITEEIFSILQASDRQLVSLFKRHNDERQLTYALFFERTKEGIAEKIGSNILAKHYKAFFEIFSDSFSYECIKRFVGHSLLDDVYTQAPISVPTYCAKEQDLNQQICSSFFEYNLRCLYYICELIYDIPDFEHFLSFLSHYLIVNYATEEDDVDMDDAFGDDEEEALTDQTGIITMLEHKIGGSKKND